MKELRFYLDEFVGCGELSYMIVLGANGRVPAKDTLMPKLV